MADTRDTLFRQWTMLRHLPRHPRRLPTQDMVSYLRDEGFEVTSRTVERDLAKLSTIFGYTSEDQGRSIFWFWPAKFKTLDIPGLDPSTALAFSLAEKHLSHLLPPSTLALLDPYFSRAEEVLDATQATPLAHWRDKVRVIGVGPTLQPARAEEAVQNTLYTALLNEQRVQMQYQSRQQTAPEAREFSPLGLVCRQGVLYLIGPLWDYKNIVQIALHRVQAAEIVDVPVHVPAGFNIDKYVKEQAEFSYPTGSGRIRLQALFSAQAAKHLEERPLANDQVIQPQDDDRVKLSATVLDTDDLVWWLLGFGAQVEVVKPVALRRKLAKIVTDTAALYVSQ